MYLTVCVSYSWYILNRTRHIMCRHLFLSLFPYKWHWFVEKHCALLFTALTHLSVLTLVTYERSVLFCVFASFKEYILMLWNAVFEKAATFPMYYSCVDGAKWHRSNTSHRSVAASDTRSSCSFIFVSCCLERKSHKTTRVLNELEKGNNTKLPFGHL